MYVCIYAAYTVSHKARGKKEIFASALSSLIVRKIHILSFSEPPITNMSFTCESEDTYEKDLFVALLVGIASGSLLKPTMRKGGWS